MIGQRVVRLANQLLGGQEMHACTHAANCRQRSKYKRSRSRGAYTTDTDTQVVWQHVIYIHYVHSWQHLDR
jgi:hypothetical protein